MSTLIIRIRHVVVVIWQHWYGKGKRYDFGLQWLVCEKVCWATNVFSDTSLGNYFQKMRTNLKIQAIVNNKGHFIVSKPFINVSPFSESSADNFSEVSKNAAAVLKKLTTKQQHSSNISSSKYNC